MRNLDCSSRVKGSVNYWGKSIKFYYVGRTRSPCNRDILRGLVESRLNPTVWTSVEGVISNNVFNTYWFFNYLFNRADEIQCLVVAMNIQLVSRAHIEPLCVFSMKVVGNYKQGLEEAV